MNHAVSASLLALATLFAAACSSHVASSADPSDPSWPDSNAVKAAAPRNIVYILLDDQDATTSPIWEALPRTKALIKDRGLTFKNAFAPTPICCAARSSILTGLYGHNTGVLTNAGTYGGYAGFRSPYTQAGAPMLDSTGKPIDNEERTVAKYLSDKGYRTVLFGKYLNGYENDSAHVPTGWSEWYAGASNSMYAGYNYKLSEYDGTGTRSATVVDYGSADEDYITDVIARKSVDFIRRAKDASNPERSKPLYMYVAPTAPHLPLQPARRHAKQAEQWKGKLPKSPNYDEADVSDKPQWLQRSADKRSRWAGFNEAEFPDRMGSLLAVDEMVDGIATALSDAGELDNTIFVFTSDNGYNLGAHRLLHKMAPYEESVRVPLYVAGPGIPKGERDHMVLDIDATPTFLELAGISIPSHIDGKSLVPLLRKSAPKSFRSDFLAQYGGSGMTVGGKGSGVEQEIPSAFAATMGVGFALDIPEYRALRTSRYLLVEWYDNPSYESVHEYELYDLERDPYQLNNLVRTNPAMKSSALFATLQARMETLSACSGASCQK